MHLPQIGEWKQFTGSWMLRALAIVITKGSSFWQQVKWKAYEAGKLL